MANKKHTTQRAKVKMALLFLSCFGKRSEAAVKIASTPVNWLSNPNVINMRKNKMDQIGGKGKLRSASGYAIKARPKPAYEKFSI